MQKPFESRTKTKQNYWFLTNETTYLNGQQPHGRRDCPPGRGPGGPTAMVGAPVAVAVAVAESLK